MIRNRWVGGAALVGVLVVVYLVAIRPARVLFLEEAAVPLFAAGDEVEAGRVELVPDQTVVLARGPGVDERGRSDSALFKTPLGDRPMLGVLALAFLYPSRRWWLALAATALAEGVLTTAFFAAGTHGVPHAFVLHRVTQAVFNDTIPLAMPALIFLFDRAGMIAADEPAAGRAQASETDSETRSVASG